MIIINLSYNFLHQIGSILHFPNPKQLKDLVILNPHWVTNAVYELLRAEQVMQQKGYFTEEDIEEIWENYELGEQIGFIELMKKFELLFEITHKPQHYIAPQLLPSNSSGDLPEMTEIAYIMVYQYKFLHKGVIGRIISKLSSFAPLGFYWKQGIMLTQDDTKSIIEAKPQDKQIWIKIEQGKKQGFLRELIQQALKEVNSSFDVEIFIPYTSLITQTTYLFPLEDLEIRIERGINEIECPLSFDKVSIEQLLNRKQTDYQLEKPVHKKIKQLIKLGHLNRALEIALELSESDNFIHKKIILIQSSLSYLQDQERLGLIPLPEIARERTLHTQALLDYLSEI